MRLYSEASGNSLSVAYGLNHAGMVELGIVPSASTALTISQTKQLIAELQSIVNKHDDAQLPTLDKA